MPNFYFMSDIHTEFDCDNLGRDGASTHIELPDRPNDTLILAGDIMTMADTYWIEREAVKFKHIVFVFGNHEFYRSSFERHRDEVAVLLPQNVHLLERDTIEIEGVRVHGCTLWTDFNRSSEDVMDAARRSMTDFALIKTDHGLLWPEHTLIDHKRSVSWLREVVQEGDVVVTHHAPSFQAVLPQFKGDILNGAFCSDLEYLILETKPSYWVYGHTHSSICFSVGDTNVVTNQRGYLNRANNTPENRDFDPMRKFSVQ